MSAENILAALTSGQKLADNRPRFTFPIPQEARLFETDPTSITLVPLRISDEIDAAKAADTKGGHLGYECARRAVVALNEKPVDWGKNEDIWLDQASPTVRELVLMAYQNVHENGIATKVAFLAGRVAAV